MDRFVEISFDCLPLRTIGRLDIPLDASPKYRERCERIKQAIATHGSHNSYFLYNARCVFHLANSPDVGIVEFLWEACVLTDESDQKSAQCELLDLALVRDTSPWMNDELMKWFRATITQAVLVEFDRYIQAGDLEQAKERIRRIQAEADEAGGFLGMNL